MDASTVAVKTEKGQEEIKNRTYKLSQRMRALLILVDGSRTAGEITQQADLLGLGPDALADLEREGFIAKKGDRSG